MENQEQKPTPEMQPVAPVPQEAPKAGAQPVAPKKMSFWQKLRFNMRGGKYRNRYNEDVNKVKATRAAEKEAHMAKPQKQTYQVNTPQPAPVGAETQVPQPAAPNQNENEAQANEPRTQS